MSPPVDFYKIYKMYIQRCRRHPSNERHLQIKESFEYLIKNDLRKEEQLEIAEKLIELENTIYAIKRYAGIIYRAIESENYRIEVPYQILNRWNETEGTVGRIYLGISSAKSGQVKLGATTTPLWKREASYQSNYGYAMNIIWSEVVRMPLTIEKKVQDMISHHRVEGLTNGDSNEWYMMEREEIISVINEVIDTL
jgi:hypothetical protein